MIRVELNNFEQGVIRNSFCPPYHQDRWEKSLHAAGCEPERVKEVAERWRYETVKHHNVVTLSKKDWEIIYQCVNTQLHLLAPYDLSTITGYGVVEFVQTSQTLFGVITGSLFKEGRWENYRSSKEFFNTTIKPHPVENVGQVLESLLTRKLKELEDSGDIVIVTPALKAPVQEIVTAVRTIYSDNPNDGRY